jgi:hypothetical protein
VPAPGVFSSSINSGFACGPAAGYLASGSGWGGELRSGLRLFMPRKVAGRMNVPPRNISSVGYRKVGWQGRSGREDADALAPM